MKINKINEDVVLENVEGKLPLIPLREMVPFPSTVESFYVGRKDSILAIECAIKIFRSNFSIAHSIAKMESLRPT